jgi:hypothetical protein
VGIDELPIASAHPSIGLGLGQWGVAAVVNLVTLTLDPTSSSYSAARQGPTSHAWAGRPRSGREIRAHTRPLGQDGGDQLTFSPLISSYILSLIFT